MLRRSLPVAFVFILASCSGWTIPRLGAPPGASPSPLPGIISPTPPFQPSVTPSGTLTLTPTLTSTLTSTATASPTTAGALELDLLGCNTSLDITHGLGEVTNAYPVIRNRTGADATDVCATLAASDEAKAHPDKTVCTSALPAGYQVTLKVTVDTGFRQDTSIAVAVVTQQGLTAYAERPSCRDLGFPGWLPGKVGLVEPIP